MQLTKNFNLLEFRCKDGTHVPEELIPNVQELANNLQVIRDRIGVPLHINSAYRTAKHNKRMGGTEKSQHLEGKAADLRADSYTPKELHRTIAKLIEEGKVKEGGLGLYKHFVHYDIRGVKARW